MPSQAASRSSNFQVPLLPVLKTFPYEFQPLPPFKAIGHATLAWPQAVTAFPCYDVSNFHRQDDNSPIPM